jgi:ribosome assembly protein YihI (activator of Der GTPase)
MEEHEIKKAVKRDLSMKTNKRGSDEETRRHKKAKRRKGEGSGRQRTRWRTEQSRRCAEGVSDWKRIQSTLCVAKGQSERGQSITNQSLLLDKCGHSKQFELDEM